MTRIVSNATPLIYLAKIGKLEILRDVFSEVIVPEQVKKEVVDKGKELRLADAVVVEAAIEKGWLKVLKTNLLHCPIDLESGELAVISLARKIGVKQVLIDESSARTAAKLFGLKPRGTMFVLLKAVKTDVIDFQEFLEIMDQLVNQGFRLKEEIYLEAIKKARKIVEPKRTMI